MSGALFPHIAQYTLLLAEAVRGFCAAEPSASRGHKHVCCVVCTPHGSNLSGMERSFTVRMHVIADASSADTALVRSFGTDIIVPRGDDIAAQIRKVAPDGVDGIADGSFQSGLTIGAVRDGGSFVSVRGWGGDERGITFHKTSVRTYDHRADLLAQLRQQVEAGIITLRVAATFPPEQATEAHRRLEAKGTRGRLVIVF